MVDNSDQSGSPAHFSPLGSELPMHDAPPPYETMLDAQIEPDGPMGGLELPLRRPEDPFHGLKDPFRGPEDPPRPRLPRAIIYDHPLGFTDNYGHRRHGLELGFVKKSAGVLAAEAFFKVIVDDEVRRLLLLPPVRVPVIRSDREFTDDLVVSPPAQACTPLNTAYLPCAGR